MKPIKKFASAGMAVAFTAVLAGCSGMSMDSMNPWSGPIEQKQKLPADATAYACSDAKRLVVRRGPGTNSVMIVFRERQFRLDQAPSAPGRYTNGSTTLQATGDEVSLEEEGNLTYANCRKAAG